MLKQLFLFNVPSHSLRLTPKKWGLHSTQHRFARLGGCWLFQRLSSRRPSGGRISISLFFEAPTSNSEAHWKASLENKEENILQNIHFKQRSALEKQGKHHSTNHPPQRAKRCWVLRWRTLGDRPLVEEREEFFALSREEEKAVWA